MIYFTVKTHKSLRIPCSNTPDKLLVAMATSAGNAALCMCINLLGINRNVNTDLSQVA